MLHISTNTNDVQPPHKSKFSVFQKLLIKDFVGTWSHEEVSSKISLKLRIISFEKTVEMFVSKWWSRWSINQGYDISHWISNTNLLKVNYKSLIWKSFFGVTKQNICRPEVSMNQCIKLGFVTIGPNIIQNVKSFIFHKVIKFINQLWIFFSILKESDQHLPD